jgi:hypothetical protein
VPYGPFGVRYLDAAQHQRPAFCQLMVIYAKADSKPHNNSAAFYLLIRMERNGVKLFNFFRSPCLLLQASVIKEKAEEYLPLLKLYVVQRK